jgi:hypothetical protein
MTRSRAIKLLQVNEEMHHMIKSAREDGSETPRGSAGPESYDALAEEYYDAEAHPTCYNMNRLSRLFLARHFPEPWFDRATMEIGAGDSCAAAILHSRGYKISGLTITDGSKRMLAHSFRWQREGAKLLECDAYSIHGKDESVALLVASLGDAYNEPRFWHEVHRVMSPAGVVLFTLPSFQWAIRFRGAAAGRSFHTAEFTLRGGGLVTVPSFIVPLERQLGIIEEAGFIVVAFESLGADSLGTAERRSPKIDVFPPGLSSIVWGFKAVRLN